MNAQNMNIHPEIEAAVNVEQLNEIKITEACMKISGGVLTLSVKDSLRPKSNRGSCEEQPKTNNERQRTYAQRKKDAGFKKDWLHKSVAALAGEFNGQEKIAAEIAKLRARAEAAEAIATMERLRAEKAEAKVQRMKARRWRLFWR